MASGGESKTDSEASPGDKTSLKNSGKYNLRQKTLVTRQETEERLKSPKLPKPKSRPPPLSKYRRKTANTRERGRMQEINVAFQKLQTVLPAQCLAHAESKGAHLTKITTLRLAVNYIAALREVLGDEGSYILETKDDQTGKQQTQDSQGNVESDNSVRVAEEGVFLNNNTKDEWVRAQEELVDTLQMDSDQSICAQSGGSIPNKDVTSTEQSELDSDQGARLNNPVLSRMVQVLQPSSGGALASQKELLSLNTIDINNNETHDDLSCLPFQKGHAHIHHVSSPYSSITDNILQPHSPSTDSYIQPHNSTIDNSMQPHSPSTDTYNQPHNSTIDNSMQPHCPSTDTYNQPHISTIDNSMQPHSPSTDTYNQPQNSTIDNIVQTHSPSIDAFTQAQSSTTDSNHYPVISTTNIKIQPHNSTTGRIHHPHSSTSDTEIHLHSSTTDTYPAGYGVSDNDDDATPILLWGEPFSESQSHTNLDTFTGEPLPDLQSHTNLDTFTGEPFPELQPHLNADTTKTGSRTMLAHTAAMDSVLDLFVHANILKTVTDDQFK